MTTMAKAAVVHVCSPELMAALSTTSMVIQLTTSSATQSVARAMLMAMGLMI